MSKIQNYLSLASSKCLKEPHCLTINSYFTVITVKSADQPSRNITVESADQSNRNLTVESADLAEQSNQFPPK